jgi:hypothetical protein
MKRPTGIGCLSDADTGVVFVPFVFFVVRFWPLVLPTVRPGASRRKLSYQRARCGLHLVARCADM